MYASLFPHPLLVWSGHVENIGGMTLYGRKMNRDLSSPYSMHACRCVTWWALLAICSFCSLCGPRNDFIFILFPPYQQRGGGGARCQTSSFCSIFPNQQTTSGIGHRANKVHTTALSGWQPDQYIHTLKWETRGFVFFAAYDPTQMFWHFFPLSEGCSEGLDALLFFKKTWFGVPTWWYMTCDISVQYNGGLLHDIILLLCVVCMV